MYRREPGIAVNIVPRPLEGGRMCVKAAVGNVRGGKEPATDTHQRW